MWDSICRHDPETVFALLKQSKSKTSVYFEDFRVWFRDEHQTWKNILHHDTCLRQKIHKVQKCIELDLCRDIEIHTVRYGPVFMTMTPGCDENIKFILKFQPVMDRDPIIDEISWTDLWIDHPSIETKRLLQNLSSDRNERKPVRRYELIRHALAEGREEISDLRDNLCSIAFTDETSIPGHILREIQYFNFHLILILFDYLFPEHLHLYMRNRMNISYELYKKDMAERWTVL